MLKIHIFLKKDITTRATYDLEKKIFVLSNDVSNSKLCDYFSYYSTHVVVFARLFIGGSYYGVFPFLINFRSTTTGQVTEKISIEWMGKVVGERTHRQYLVRFNDLEIPLSSLVINKCSIVFLLKRDFKGIRR